MKDLYILQNPREEIKYASISVFFLNGKEYASVSVEWKGNSLRNLGYQFKGLTAAKRYFGQHYQSKKHGFETPIWKE
jgi:hypothetical protein